MFYIDVLILLQDPKEEPDNVPFHISSKFKVILTQLVDHLKTTVPYGRPALMDYFTDEYEKIKIAETLVFCGDVGSYLINLTDIQAEVKGVFVDLLKVSEIITSKCTPTDVLKQAEKKLVRVFLFCSLVYT